LDVDNPTDTLLGLIFNYRDGDGDIGLNAADTFPPFNSITGFNNVQLNPYHHNLKVDYLTEQLDGTFAPVILPNTTDTLKIQARVENITPEGKYKAIRGEIDWQILPPPFAELSRNIKVKIQIYDRSLNASNIIESPIITLP